MTKCLPLNLEYFNCVCKKQKKIRNSSQPILADMNFWPIFWLSFVANKSLFSIMPYRLISFVRKTLMTWSKSAIQMNGTRWTSHSHTNINNINKNNSLFWRHLESGCQRDDIVCNSFKYNLTEQWSLPTEQTTIGRSIN